MSLKEKESERVGALSERGTGKEQASELPVKSFSLYERSIQYWGEFCRNLYNRRHFVLHFELGHLQVLS